MADPVIKYQVGPVSAASARAWLQVARGNLERILAAGDRAPFRIPAEVADEFFRVLDGWDAAAEVEPFLFRGEVEQTVARSLLTYWLNIVSLSAEQRSVLSVQEWPAESAPFEHVVGRSILSGLGADERLRRIFETRRQVRG